MKVKSSDADKEDSVHANSSESDGSLEVDFPGVAGADVACFLK